MGALLDRKTEKRVRAALVSRGITELQKRRLEVVLKLNSGEVAAAVAREFSISPSNVSLIRKHASDQASFHAYLARIESKGRKIVPKDVETAVLEAAKAGHWSAAEIAKRHTLSVKLVRDIARANGVVLPRGIATVREFTEGLDITEEPVIELAALYVNQAAHVGVFALREITAGSTLLRSVFLHPKHDVPCWTNIDERDVRVTEVFQRLSERRAEWNEGDWTGTAEFVARVKAAFPAPYHLAAVIWQSPRVGRSRRLAKAFKIGNAAPIVVDWPAEFFSTLERIAFAFRNRRSCPGLFPNISELVSFLRTDLDEKLMNNIELMAPEMAKGVVERYALKRQRTLTWISNMADVDAAVAESKKSQLYLAVRPGLLWELTPHLWRALPFANHVSLPEFNVRAKVHHDPISGSVAIEPLPEVGFRLRHKCSSASTARTMRADLNASDLASRLVYSNGLDDLPGVRPRFNDLPIEEIAAAARIARNRRSSTALSSINCPLGSAVVLVSRHLLFSPAVATAVLADQPQTEVDNCRIQSIRLGTGQTVECLVFEAPSLIRAVDNHFSMSTYHRLLTEAECGQRAALKADMDIKMHLPDEDLSGGFTVAPEDEWDEADPLSGVSVDCSPPSLTVGNPANGKEGFLALFRNCDADFLLSAIAADKRRALRRMTQMWTDGVYKILCEEFFTSDGKPERKKILKLWPKTSRRDPDLAEDTFFTALTRFACRPRVTRLALENAGRLVSAAHEPRAIAVVPKEAIISQFQTYLSKSFFRDAVRKYKRSAQQSAVTSKTASRSDGRANVDILEHLDQLRNGFLGDMDREGFWRELSELASQFDHDCWEDAVHRYLPDNAQLRKLVLQCAAKLRQIQSKNAASPTSRHEVDVLKTRLESEFTKLD